MRTRCDRPALGDTLHMLALTLLLSSTLATGALTTGTPSLSAQTTSGTSQKASATRDLRFNPAHFAKLQSGHPLPTIFESVVGTGLRLERKTVVDAPPDQKIGTKFGTMSGVHFQFQHPTAPEREASLLLREGRLTGFVSDGQLRYEIRSAIAGVAAVTLAASTSDLPCAMTDEHRATGAEPEGGPAGAACDTGSIIQVYVAYTDAAVVQAGSETLMLDQILWAIGDSNAIYTNSGIAVALQLAGTERATGYAENTSSMATDLYALRDPVDGSLDGVLANATAAGADLTALVRADGGGACGIAFLVGGSVADVDFGVSVTALGCFSNRTFTHELGHNMGCCHAPGDGGGCLSGGVFPYSTGHRFTGTNGTQYRTVMAYSPGTRIGRFSSPSVVFQGTPTGIADERDNARTINVTRLTVANFRCTPCPADLTGDRTVDAADLAAVLSGWGEGQATGDLDGDGNTGAADLAILLGAWGACE